MSAETVEIGCRNGHVHVYPGPAGRAVKCKECRVSVWLRKGAAQALSRLDDAAPSLRELWSQEGPPGPLTDDEDDSQYNCSNCDQVLYWEGRRTLLYCFECKTWRVPPFVVGRYRQRLSATASRSTSSEVAVQGPSPAEVRKAQALLAGERETVVDEIRQMYARLNLDGIPEHTDERKQAVKWRGALTSYLSNVQSAQSLDELAEIRTEMGSYSMEIESVIQRVGFKRDAIERYNQQVAEQQAVYDAEVVEDDEYEWDDEDDDESAITSARKPLAITSGNSTAMLATMLIMRQQKNKARGHCAYPHTFKAVARFDVYGTQYPDTAYGPDGYGPIKACAKHLETAQQYIGELGWAYYRSDTIGVY